MNPEKLKQLQEQVRIGGKGSARRKKKVIHRSNTTDDKKLQSSLKKLGVNNIPGIEEVNMIREDGNVIHFNNPKVQASLPANTFTIVGHTETKKITELLPSIVNQLDAEDLARLKRELSSGATKKEVDAEARFSNFMDTELEDEEVPTLVEDFDAPSKDESA